MSFLTDITNKLESVFGKLDDTAKASAVEALAVVGSQNLDALKIAFVASFLSAKTGQDSSTSTLEATALVNGLDALTGQLHTIIKS